MFVRTVQRLQKPMGAKLTPDPRKARLYEGFEGYVGVELSWVARKLRAPPDLGRLLLPCSHGFHGDGPVPEVADRRLGRARPDALHPRGTHEPMSRNAY